MAWAKRMYAAASLSSSRWRWLRSPSGAAHGDVYGDVCGDVYGDHAPGAGAVSEAAPWEDDARMAEGTAGGGGGVSGGACGEDCPADAAARNGGCGHDDDDDDEDEVDDGGNGRGGAGGSGVKGEAANRAGESGDGSWWAMASSRSVTKASPRNGSRPRDVSTKAAIARSTDS